MIKKIYSLFRVVGMSHFWGNFFDSRFYVAYLISKFHDEVILDIGCGSGILLNQSTAKIKIGIDLSYDSLKDAKKINKNVELICGNAIHLPFKNSQFSFILAVQLFPQLKKSGTNWEKAISEMVRISNEKSTIIIAGNNRMSRHFKDTPMDLRTNYLSFEEQLSLLKRYFKIEIFGYDPHSKVVMFPIKKILLFLPDKISNILKIEKLVFVFLKSKRYLKNGRSYVMICKKNEKK